MKLELVKTILKKIPILLEWLNCIKNVRQTKIKVDKLEKELSDKIKEEIMPAILNDKSVNLGSFKEKMNLNIQGDNNKIIFTAGAAESQMAELKNIEEKSFIENDS